MCAGHVYDDSSTKCKFTLLILVHICVEVLLSPLFVGFIFRVIKSLCVYVCINLGFKLSTSSLCSLDI